MLIVNVLGITGYFILEKRAPTEANMRRGPTDAQKRTYDKRDLRKFIAFLKTFNDNQNRTWNIPRICQCSLGSTIRGTIRVQSGVQLQIRVQSEAGQSLVLYYVYYVLCIMLLYIYFSARYNETGSPIGSSEENQIFGRRHERKQF